MKAVMQKIAASAGVSFDEVLNALGLNSNATPDEVKKAKRKFAMDNHPDRNPGKESSYYTKIMSGFDDFFDSDHKKKSGARSWGTYGSSDSSGAYGSYGHKSEWGKEYAEKEKERNARRRKEENDRWDRAREQNEAKWRDFENAKRKDWEARQDASTKERLRGYISDSERSSKLNSTANLASSAFGATIAIGGLHLGQKYHEDRKEKDQADLYKNIKRKQMIGQGLGWAGGALAGYAVNKKNPTTHYEVGAFGDSVKKHLGNRALDNLKRNKKIERISEGGLVGQMVGTLGATMFSMSDFKKLDNLEAKRRLDAREYRQNRRLQYEI